MTGRIRLILADLLGLLAILAAGIVCVRCYPAVSSLMGGGT